MNLRAHQEASRGSERQNYSTDFSEPRCVLFKKMTTAAWRHKGDEATAIPAFLAYGVDFRPDFDQGSRIFR
jgi:hypothetical protein